MKLFSFILSVYVLCLAIMPCTDGIACSENMVQNEVHHHDHNDENGETHEHEGETDCTPFCTCVCCGSLFTSPEITPFLVANFIPYLEHNSTYKFQYAWEFIDSIWHPPSLG